MDNAAGQILYPLHRCKTVHLVCCNFILQSYLFFSIFLKWTGEGTGLWFTRLFHKRLVRSIHTCTAYMLYLSKKILN